MNIRHTPHLSRSILGCGAAALALLMAGCAANAPGHGKHPAPRPVQVCNAQPVQHYVGQNSAPSTLEAIRQKSGSYMLRVLRQGQPATMDLNQERLNVITNDAGKILALRCG